MEVANGMEVPNVINNDVDISSVDVVEPCCSYKNSLVTFTDESCASTSSDVPVPASAPSFSYLTSDILTTNEDVSDPSTNLKQDCSIDVLITRKKGFLRNLGLKSKELTPQEELMYKVHRNSLSRISKLKHELDKKRDSLKSLQKLYTERKFQVIDEALTLVSKEFINCQLENCNRSGPAKRYSFKFKLFTLSMYKRSPRLYRYLKSYFELPCPRTLQKLLNSLSFDTGFNNNALASLASRVNGMNESDRFCSLVFDEMKLSDSFYYDRSSQVIVGYEDLGELGRFKRNADHALVLMARGLRRRWKQPVAYYFTCSSISTIHLKSIILNALSKFKSVNLKPILTICDQGSTNQAAISQLCLNNFHYFLLDGDVICTMYDPLHLFKNTRNGAINNLIEFAANKRADFDFIITVFNLDQTQQFKLLPDLSQADFNFKNSYVKMKGSVAARQFSRRMAAAIEI